MNNRFFLAVLLIIAGVIVFGVKKPNNDSVQKNNGQLAVAGTQGKSVPERRSQKKEFGAVTVEITPSTIEVDSPMVFSLSLNTHSVDLDYDFMSVLSLTDQEGKIYEMTDWTGDSGGHHLSGEAVFETLKPSSTTFSLTVEGIDGESAVYKWDI